MAKISKATDNKIRRRPLRRQGPRGRQQAEADDQHVLSPVEQRDASTPAVELTENRLSLATRQGLAQSIAQRQGNGRMQRLMGIVQRKKAALQRKKKPVITTPLPTKGVKKLKSGNAQLIIQGQLITILADKVSDDKSLTGQAETKCDIDWGHAPAYDYRDAVVIKLKGRTPTPRITIRTTYGPDAKAADPSAYGRGTTAEDKKAGNTSLGFHEGQHGLNFLEYLRANRLPKFMGAVGMTVADYEAAKSAYERDTQSYSTKMGEQSKAQTDCVGTKASFCEKHSQ
jgi:hypothetical protein